MKETWLYHDLGEPRTLAVVEWHRRLAGPVLEGVVSEEAAAKGGYRAEVDTDGGGPDSRSFERDDASAAEHVQDDWRRVRILGLDDLCKPIERSPLSIY
jgi:hypothetical protein